MGMSVRRSNPSYNSYTGKKNREHIKLDMSDSLIDRLMRTMRVSMQNVESRGGLKKEYNTFLTIYNRLREGKKSLTARQYDQLWFECNQREKDELENLRKMGPTIKILQGLGD